MALPKGYYGEEDHIGIARSYWYFTALDTPHSLGFSGLPSDPASTKKLLPTTRCKFKIQREGGKGPDPSPSPFILSALRAASETYTETVAEASLQFLQQESSFFLLAQPGQSNRTRINCSEHLELLPLSHSLSQKRVREEERPYGVRRAVFVIFFGLPFITCRTYFFPTEKAKPPPAHMLLLFLCVCCAMTHFKKNIF